MGTKITLTLLLFTLTLCLVSCLPNIIPKENEEKNSVGMATNVIASTVLKNHIDSDENLVFSPFAFSTILTQISEGAKADTLQQIQDTLRYPADMKKVREQYHETLKRLQGDSPLKAPQFKTWFYIYRNNTAEDEYKKILKESYFVEVKDIDRDFYNWNEPKTSLPSSDNVSSNSKDILGFEDLKSAEPIKDGEKPDFPNETIEKECSKFDEVVEDQQYVEVPQIKEEILKEQMKNPIDNEINDEFVDDDEKKIIEIKEKSEEPEKILIPLKKFDDLEILQAMEDHPATRKFYGRVLRAIGDVTSALSGNSLIGDEPELDQDGVEKYLSKMLLFNGLYYKGNWATPFQQLRSDSEDVFYTSESSKEHVTMMRSRGSYKVAYLKELDSQVIELPYENDRYALLILLPKTHQGLRQLIESFSPEIISEILPKLQSDIVHLAMPKFRMDTTSRAEKPLMKTGLSSLFNENADLSGISKSQKLHIDELVQHVSFRVDEGSSSENVLTATGVHRSNPDSEETILVDKPFLFFVRDVIDDSIIIAGKVMNPPSAVDEF